MWIGADPTEATKAHKKGAMQWQDPQTHELKSQALSKVKDARACFYKVCQPGGNHPVADQKRSATRLGLKASGQAIVAEAVRENSGGRARPTRQARADAAARKPVKNEPGEQPAHPPNEGDMVIEVDNIVEVEAPVIKKKQATLEGKLKFGKVENLMEGPDALQRCSGRGKLVVSHSSEDDAFRRNLSNDLRVDDHTRRASNELGDHVIACHRRCSMSPAPFAMYSSMWRSLPLLEAGQLHGVCEVSGQWPS